MPRLSKIGAAALAAFGWTSGSAVSASYLVVAGGGGGGSNATSGGGGGGGAGGYRTGTASLNPTLSYTVTVGAGGAGSVSGSDSIFNSITSTGGGKGGTFASPNGASGGSGGGGAYVSGTGGSGNTPSTSPSQGNNGGNGNASVGSAAGGGGASAAANNVPGSGSVGSAGGAGTANSISGSSVTYAGGGGGGSDTTGSAGGAGGGGAGAGGASGNGTAGTANLGGGGGGSARSGTGGQSGSGIVIISYAGAQQFGGGVVTSSGGNTIHTFTTSGTLSPITPLSASYLVVAVGGGGGGGRGGGGGGGGFLTSTGVAIDTNSIYLVTVGAGGIGATAGVTANGTSGGNSAWSIVSTAAVGGGGGGTSLSGGSTANNGLTGGSGGGGSGRAIGSPAGTGGAATSGQGFAGGNGITTAPLGGGGGGGASGVGATGKNTGTGAGGDGLASSLSGSSVTYGGGGGGGSDTTAASGGTGGGGNSGTPSAGTGVAGTTNLGGGGGGGSGGGANGGSGGNGGSGIVIISYPGSTQQMAGGTVTITGGNVIHTFTSTGFLAPLDFVGNSLRFRSSASAYLNRTLTTPTNNKIWTWSAWVKRGTLGDGGTASTAKAPLFDAPSSGSTFGAIYIRNADNIVWYEASGGATVYYLETSQVFRDPAAWYHFQFVYDSTQATAADRQKMYVNGVQVTAFSSASYVAQNTNGRINSAVVHKIGAYDAGGTYFDGYMTEINFIDGQALTPNSFGTRNSYGVWQPITYGGSYGINGFYLPFTNQSVSASYLVVAGGGGGGTDYAGGGGAGGLLNSTTTLSSNLSYTVTVGAGGAAVTQGNSSVFSSFTATGGGKGGGNNGAGASGGSGGSGGGAAGSNAGGAAGAGTSGQGFAGGTSAAVGTAGGGGGGGASAVGSNGISNAGGAGGAGTSSSISGSSVAYAGGGGGGGYTPAGTSAGAGGTGGGGAGAASGGGTAGTANRGGGGGGGAGAGGAGGAGGSGVVIVSYAGVQRFTGGTVTASGGNTIHTFTSSSTLAGYLAGDYSSNGNNWTQNNISTTAGVTFDSMTDVPTLTSATAANFCTLNPLDKTPASTTITASNGNLQVTSTNAGTVAECMASTIAMSANSGKWYWECQFTTENDAVGTPNTGIIDATLQITADCYLGSSAAPASIGFSCDGQIRTPTGNTSYTNPTSSQVVGFAYDSSNGKLWVAVAGTWQNSGDPAAGTGQVATASWYANGAKVANSSNRSLVTVFNFGQRPFAYTPPTGFVALNTFNL